MINFVLFKFFGVKCCTKIFDMGKSGLELRGRAEVYLGRKGFYKGGWGGVDAEVMGVVYTDINISYFLKVGKWLLVAFWGG